MCDQKFGLNSAHMYMCGTIQGLYCCQGVAQPRQGCPTCGLKLGPSGRMPENACVPKKDPRLASLQKQVKEILIVSSVELLSFCLEIYQD